MSDQEATSSDEGGEQRIDVHLPATDIGLTQRHIQRAVAIALDHRPLRCLSIALVDDEEIARLHERYMDQPGATDVLTFDLRDEPASREVEGEIVVSVDTARRQADELGTAFREELVRYVIHGVLHLTGKDDRTTDQRKTMRFAENRILARCIEDETLGPTLASPRQRAKGALR